ncbi:MAG: tetratricopeptide repeat protein, partial [Chloroflexota bacterium]
MTKRRGKRHSRRHDSAHQKRQSQRRLDSDLELALQRAERSIRRGQPKKAIALLEPLLATHPGKADLHTLLGYARTALGDLWGALSAHETAATLRDDPLLLFPEAVLYSELGLPMHALRVSREMIARGAASPAMNEVRAAVAAHDRELAATARSLGIPVEQVEQGLYQMEKAHRALNSGDGEPDLEAAVAANRRAVRYLGDYPPPRNNLSQVLFFAGRIRAAVDEVQQVLATHPDNVHALSDGIRFLSWMGREDEARAMWARLARLVPQGPSHRLKKAEAAASLAEHESVYQVLKPLDEPAVADESPSSIADEVQFFLAVAEANTSRRALARRRLQALEQSGMPLAAEYLAALNEGKSGRGWADHFPYFHMTDLLPPQHLDALFDLAR